MIVLTDQDRAALDSLISRLNDSPTQTAAVGDRLWRAHLEASYERLRAGETYGAVSAMPDIYAGTEDQFNAGLRATADQLWRQCMVCQHFLDLWFSIGERVPPYFVARIPVILRKAKEPELERRFLAAIMRQREAVHMGARMSKVIERATALGIDATR